MGLQTINMNVFAKIDWLTVKNFGKVRHFNISYLVMIGIPILATVYEAVASSIPSIAFSMDFPLKLKFIYSASISYAIAIAIYQYFCDPIVKRYNGSEDYIGDVQDAYERAFPDKKYEIIIANLVESQTQLKSELITFEEEKKAGRIDSKQIERYKSLVQMLYPSCVQRYLASRYDHAVLGKSRKALIFSFLFYIVGSFLILIVLIWQTIVVFRQ